MKSIIFIIIIFRFASMNGVAQTSLKKDTLIKATDVNKTPTATINTSGQQKNIVTKQLNQKPIKAGFQPSPPLDEPKIYLTSGENGKSGNTILVIAIDDSKQLKAADYNEVGLTTSVEDDRYPNHTKYVPFIPVFGPNQNESLSAKLVASEPQAVEVIGILPYTVTRYAVLSDFANGGSISIAIFPKMVYPLIGPDIWNINSFTVSVNFGGDPTSLHKMTWNGFTLSPSAPSRTLKFDKSFNPIE